MCLDLHTPVIVCCAGFTHAGQCGAIAAAQQVCTLVTKYDSGHAHTVLLVLRRLVMLQHMMPDALHMAPVAGVLASEPELFFLSSALSLTGFGDQLPSPNLPVTVFAPTNDAILNLLNNLSAFAAPCHVEAEYCMWSLLRRVCSQRQWVFLRCPLGFYRLPATCVPLLPACPVSCGTGWKDLQDPAYIMEGSGGFLACPGKGLGVAMCRLWESVWDEHS